MILIDSNFKSILHNFNFPLLVVIFIHLNQYYNYTYSNLLEVFLFLIHYLYDLIYIGDFDLFYLIRIYSSLF